MKFDKPYEAILNCMNEAVYFIDREMNILYSNPAAEVLTGFPVAEAQGAKCHDIFCETSFRCKDLCPPKVAMREKKPILHREAETKTRNGEVKNTEISFSPFYEGAECVGSVIVIKDITEIKKAEEALLYFQKTVDSATDAIGMSTPEGRHYYQNEAFTKLFGLSVSEVDGVSGPPSTIYADQKEGAKVFDTIMKGGSFAGEVKMLDKDRNERDIYLRAYPIKSKDGKIVGLIGMLTDITDRKRAEEKLHRSEEKFRNLFHNAEIGMFRSKIDGSEMLDMNQKFLDIVGKMREETQGKPALVLWADPKEREEMIRRLVADGRVAKFEFNILNKQGRVRNCLASAVLYPEQGILEGSIIDITELKLAEEYLRKSENKYRTLIENLPQRIFYKDRNSVYISCNKNFADDLRIKPDEIEGRTDFDFSPKKIAEKYRADDKRLVDLGKAEDIEEKYIKHGQEVWIYTVKTPIMDDSGNVTGILGIFWDITERKKAEEKLKKSEMRLRESQEVAKIGSWSFDVVNNTLDWSDETFRRFDKDPATFTTSVEYFVGLIHSDDSKTVQNAMQDALKINTPYHVQAKIINETGREWVMEAFGRVERDSEGNPLRFAGTAQDITDRKKLEEQLRQSQKLEAIGTLAGGIAHDFNNLLQGVFGYISMAKLNAINKDKSIAALEQAEKALHMSVDLTKQLLTFSKGGKPVKKKISLQSVIENSVRFALSGSSSDYRIKLYADLWHVEADEGQIGQVIQNIVLNADQAMPMGGTIVIAAGNVPASGKGIPHLPKEGMYVEISVEDKGIGISEEYLSKIFDPYFTTKAKGSGLGLATCYSIVRNHGGVIRVSSNVGKGTTFYVYLPAVEVEKDAPKAPDLSPFVRKAKILFMDDEAMIRDIAGDMIGALDHEADFAEHGEAAIEKYKASMESGKPFDIVILDLTIRGGMGGRETIERLLAINSKIKAVVSSGYSDDTIVSDYHNYGFSARLAKPYKLEELRDLLNSLLRQ